MFDTHYDLLTKLYISYKRNDFKYIENWLKNYNSDNVTGLIANLCFMSEEEMEKEYDINYLDNSVIEIFKKSIELLYKYLPAGINCITSIEGCDYFKDENDLIDLKKLGLNAIAPVWNNKNKFGSGNRSSLGLTTLGEKLISKAVELSIGIDLSHANERTFWDIINYIKKNNLNPIIYASHSNARSICENSRNLTDEQIKAIYELGGFVGILSNSGFVEKNAYKTRENLKGTNEYYDFINYLKKKYVSHILYINKLLGCIDNIAVCTDDMGFCELDDYSECPIFDYKTVARELRLELLNYYSEEEVNKIMHENAEKYLSKIYKIDKNSYRR